MSVQWWFAHAKLNPILEKLCDVWLIWFSHDEMSSKIEGATKNNLKTLHKWVVNNI
jgi:hypothetical protein